MIQRTLGLALLLVALVQTTFAQGTPKTQAADFDPQAMTQRFKAKLQPALEDVLGAAFGEPVEFEPTTVDGIAKIIAGENRRLLAELVGGARGAELDEQCVLIGKQVAPMVMGKIDLESGVLRVVKAGFELRASLDESWRPIGSQRFLDLILVHEAVHVYQDRTFDLEAFVGSPRTLGELNGCMAVIEGHAQYITRRVIQKLGLQDAFDLFVAINTEVPPSVKDPLQRAQIKTQMASLAFPYLEGERFFTALVDELGYGKAMLRVFENPPVTLRQVSRYEEYLNPPKDGVDLPAIGQAISALFPKDKFAAQAVPFPEGSLRAALASAGAEKVDGALSAFRGSMVIIGSSRAKQGAQAIVLVMQFDTEDGAEAMREVEELVLRKKDEQMQAEGSSLELVSAEYQPARIEGASGLYVAKEVKVEGMAEPVIARSLVLKAGKFVIEFVFNQVPGDAESDRAFGKKVLEVVTR